MVAPGQDAGDARPTRVGDGADERDLDAGGFSAWLVEVDGALRGTGEADVACGGCTACCASSQFVHIAPDERDALAHIPAELLFPAPRLPIGHVLLGYDADGRCPMLTDAGCSIYEHRPRTCRTYDCRIFPATGLLPGSDKPLIEQRARRWRFSHPTELDRAEHDAVLAATAFVCGHADELCDPAPTSETQLAVLGLQARDAFMPGASGDGAPEVAEVRVAIERRRG
jgi:Fe-S-cluster containining protein